MIRGGLNGGALTVVLTIAVLCACFASVAATATLIAAVIAFMGTALTSLAFFIAAEILLALLMVTVIEMNRSMLEDYMDYILPVIWIQHCRHQKWQGGWVKSVWKKYYWLIS